MRFFVKVKQLGKRRPLLENRPFELQKWPAEAPLRDFLAAVVRAEVERFNSKNDEQPVFQFLTENAIDEAAASGKIGFGALYSSKKEAAEKAAEKALLAFKDGLFAVFLDKKEAKSLDAPVILNEGSEVIFVRLAFLHG